MKRQIKAKFSIVLLRDLPLGEVFKFEEHPSSEQCRCIYQKIKTANIDCAYQLYSLCSYCEGCGYIGKYNAIFFGYHSLGIIRL